LGGGGGVSTMVRPVFGSHIPSYLPFLLLKPYIPFGSCPGILRRYESSLTRSIAPPLL